MLTAQQQAFVQALEELDLQQVQRLLTDGLSLNFIDPEKGPVISVWSDGLFNGGKRFAKRMKQVHHCQNKKNNRL